MVDAISVGDSTQQSTAGTVDNNDAVLAALNTSDSKYDVELDDRGRVISAELKAENKENNQDTDNKQERPEGLPEKFKSVDDLIKAYAELEKKQGSNAAEDDSDPLKIKSEDQDTQEKETTQPTTVDEALKQKGLDWAQLQQEFTDNDSKLTDDTYKRLAGAGWSKPLVDQFIAGQQSIMREQQNNINAIQEKLFSEFGGKESVAQLTAWGKENLSNDEKVSFNQSVDSGNPDTMRMALSYLQSRYNTANGTSTGNLVSSDAASSVNDGVIGFTSQSEMVAAMSDKRYRTDRAYQDQVAKRLVKTSWIHSKSK